MVPQTIMTVSVGPVQGSVRHQQQFAECATHLTIHHILEHSRSVLQSYNNDIPNSGTGGHIIDSPHVDTLFEDDIFKNRIPVVRDVVCTQLYGSRITVIY